jgi:solute carrier family 39 (zinc transporter), member 1/2/3
MQFSFQILAALIIFATGLVGGALALRSGRQGDGMPTLLARLGGPAAGGVFLGAGFIHMLGDANDTFTSVLPDTDFPMAYLLAAVGFVAVLAIERVVFKAATAAQGPYAYILTLVLGFHSMLAGIALGVEDTALVGMAIAIAIVAHKGAAAFALGTSFVKAGMARRQAWGLIATFSCITPLGILAGMLLGNLLAHKSGEMVEAVFDSLAAGSFLYIAALDIIQDEFGDRPQSHVPAYLALLGGLGLMAVIAIWT